MQVKLTAYEDKNESVHINIEVQGDANNSPADVAKAYKEVVEELSKEEGEAK